MSGVLALVQLPVVLAREGFQDTLESPEEIFHGKCLAGSGLLCFNRTALLMFIVFGLLAVLLIAATARPQLVPSGLQNVAESAYGFIRRDVVLGVIGPEGEKYTPYLTSLFVFVFLASLIEVIPGVQFPVTSRMAWPALFAIISWGIYNYAGIRAKGFGGYLKGIMFPPGVPKPLYIIVTPIEFAAAEILRPLTLAIRLFANFFAGHLLLVVAFVGTDYLIHSPVTAVFAPVSFLGGIVGIALEIFIAAVQAYVFALLTAAYIRLSTVEEH
ncbi:MAG: F0F1 ATP synthase subunit A [Actinomycetota bacterium]